jgi:hypothetical protein
MIAAQEPDPTWSAGSAPDIDSRWPTVIGGRKDPRGGPAYPSLGSRKSAMSMMERETFDFSFFRFVTILLGKSIATGILP